MIHTAMPATAICAPTIERFRGIIFQLWDHNLYSSQVALMTSDHSGIL